MKNWIKILVVAGIAGYGLAASADEPTQKGTAETVETKLTVGQKAPDFKINDSGGKLIDLAELTAKGPVLVRLTCGCSGCDKELAYFQEIHEAYKAKGLTSLAIFTEPDAKVEAYVKAKKLNMLYAVDTKGESWNVFQTKSMPTNFLIDKNGKIVAIAAGCDTTGLVAQKLSEKVAGVVDSEAVDKGSRRSSVLQQADAAREEVELPSDAAGDRRQVQAVPIPSGVARLPQARPTRGRVRRVDDRRPLTRRGAQGAATSPTRPQGPGAGRSETARGFARLPNAPGNRDRRRRAGVVFLPLSNTFTFKCAM
jgi:peroxiredoxin